MNWSNGLVTVWFAIQSESFKQLTHTHLFTVAFQTLKTLTFTVLQKTGNTKSNFVFFTIHCIQSCTYHLQATKKFFITFNSLHVQQVNDFGLQVKTRPVLIKALYKHTKTDQKCYYYVLNKYISFCSLLSICHVASDYFFQDTSNITFKFTTKYESYFFKYITQVTLFSHLFTETSPGWDKLEWGTEALSSGWNYINCTFCVKGPYRQNKDKPK